MDSLRAGRGADHNETYQNVVVMRHGDRIDNFEPLWVSTAARPWDPPLIDDGFVRSFRTGQRLRSQIASFPIHRVLVSPFLRCIQTASEVIAALSALDVDPSAMSSKDVTSIDKRKLKVSVEFGLSEVLNGAAIRLDLAPKDGDFGFNISELEATLPAEMVDRNVEPVYKQLPKWEETMEDARSRYVDVVKALAAKYPSENLLLITHGEGVGTVFSAFMKDATVYEVDYCGYAELQRPVSDKDSSLSAGEFKVVTSHGIKYLPSSSVDDDAPIISQTPV